MSLKKGDRFLWNGVDVVVRRVASNGQWADITAASGTTWTKRQPLPFSDSFVPVPTSPGSEQ